MAKIAEVQEVAVADLRPYERNAKQHGREQVAKIVASIKEFGFVSPCLIDRDMNIIAGHGRMLAALDLGMETVPCVFIEGLTEAQRRAYILADNKLTELGGWDMELVQSELEWLNDMDFDVDLTGFEISEEEIPFNLDRDEEVSESVKCTITFETVKEFKLAEREINELAGEYSGTVSVKMG